MVAFIDAKSDAEFNFVMSNGSASQFKNNYASKEIRLQPAGVPVKRVVLWYEDARSLLYKIELYSKDGAKLLETGFNTDGCKSHEIVLEEGERIIGVKSRNLSGCPSYAYHCDF